MQSLAVTGRGAVAPAGRAEHVVFRTLRCSKPRSVHEPRPRRSLLLTVSDDLTPSSGGGGGFVICPCET